MNDIINLTCGSSWSWITEPMLAAVKTRITPLGSLSTLPPTAFKAELESSPLMSTSETRQDTPNRVQVKGRSPFYFDKGPLRVMEIPRANKAMGDELEIQVSTHSTQETSTLPCQRAKLRDASRTPLRPKLNCHLGNKFPIYSSKDII